MTLQHMRHMCTEQMQNAYCRLVSLYDMHSAEADSDEMLADMWQSFELLNALKAN